MPGDLSRRCRAVFERYLPCIFDPLSNGVSDYSSCRAWPSLRRSARGTTWSALQSQARVFARSSNMPPARPSSAEERAARNPTTALCCELPPTPPRRRHAARPLPPVPPLPYPSAARIPARPLTSVLLFLLFHPFAIPQPFRISPPFCSFLQSPF